MLRRLLSLMVLCWVLGFIVFAVTLPTPAPISTSGDGGSGASSPISAVIVLTGADGRIARGLAVLRRGGAGRMLVAGVDPEVAPREFAAQYHVERHWMQCCITLGTESVDTRSNAQEARKWIALRRIMAVRLVTSDWHMRRAYWELRRVLPAGVSLIADAVPTQPRLNTLVMEYCKLLARRAAALAGR